ncbi:hypothetical protein GRAN_2464 [Granulicella sibirica]|uniref:Uncharacterized protein n=1 Tax=Granulicella sibirica TaxID=2479048 RepID=A0A4Q0SXL6_9BACT|nr:hypothetical protein GRAN_2464 [Granulicella sibirica]
MPDREYRCPPSDHGCKSPHGLSSFEEHTTAKGNPFTINFVEYNDAGQPWNHVELTDALDQVKKATGPKGDQSAIVMIYIHGWENNADEVPGDCQDVCHFRDTLLTRLADEQGAAARPLKVVGIYLAWRGLTFTVEPFKHVFSYWPRRGVARHVGQTGMYQALTEIEAAAKPQRDQYVLVVAGHSFGARVLENAAETKDSKHTGFMRVYRTNVQRYAQMRRSQSMTAQAEALTLNSDLPVDLIFYVNAATASTVSRETIKETQSTCAAEPQAPICGANPFYLAVTSHADLATGIIMPIANFVFPALTSDHLRLISAANTWSLHTHADPVPGCGQDAAICFSVGSGTAAVMKSVHAIPGRTQIPGDDKRPFWIFNVGKDVIKDHCDVWNDSVTDLVTHVIVGKVQRKGLSN